MRRFGFFRTGICLVGLLMLMLACAAAGHAAARDAVWPDAAGSEVKKNGKLVLDISNKKQGYVMARVKQAGKHRFKLRMSFGKTELTYDLNQDGDFEVFPLQQGSGSYTISLFENVKGKKYSAQGKVSLKVKLDDENAAFLVPNQYVDYGLFTKAVKKSDELCAGASPSECYKIITNYITTEFSYDFVRAATVKSGMLPDIDYCYENHMGICQDLSAVMACMLRVQGVPSKLVIGYADKYYHAWNFTVVDGKEQFFDPTVAVGALHAKKYQVERMY